MKARLSKRLRVAAGLVALAMSGWLVSAAAFADESLAFTCKRLAPEAKGKPSLLTATFAVPEYPKRLSNNKVSGLVVASYRVGDDGRAADIEVLASPHTDFERKVVQSILGARFDVTQRSVEQGNLRSCILYEFRINNFIRPWQRFSFPAKASENLPERFQYDEPPITRLTGTMVYPRSLALDGVEGSATVIFVIDQEGHVSQHRIVTATHPEFGEAAAAALRASHFEPARRGGQPTASLFSKTIAFNRYSIDAEFFTSEDRNIVAALHNRQSNIYSSNDLDAAPVALYRVLPDYRPKSKDAAPVSLVIDVVLDEEGYVHFPVVAEGEINALAWDAMTALLRWQFSPPTRAGKPVRAYVRVPLMFVAPADQ